MNRYILSFAFVFCALFANTGQCQWVQTNMPGGGGIYGLAISGTDFFAGTNVGLFHSTDKGLNWTAVTSEFPLLNGFVQPFAVGTNFFVVASATTGDHLFRSTDNGISWELSDSGLPRSYYPASFATMGSKLFMTVLDSGVFLSTNNGLSWSLVNNGLPAGAGGPPAQWVQAIGANLFAYFGGDFYCRDTLYRSIDSGENWSPVKGGLPDSTLFACIFSIDSSIFAGTRYKGIYRSTDNGSTWTTVNSGLTNYTDLSVDHFAASGMIIIAAASSADIIGPAGYISKLFRSADNGAHWTEVNAGITANMYLGFFMASGTDLFAGGWSGNFSGGIYSSADNGTSWTAINSGLTGYRVNALVCNDTNLIAGTDIGVFLSSNNGTNWITINSGFTATATNSITSLATIGSNIIAGTEGWDTSAGIYYSTDNGKSWNTGYSEKTPGNQTWVYSIAVSGTTIFAVTNFYILRSIDSGVTWTKVADTGAFSLAVMGTNIFAGSNQLGVLRSVDNGASWSNASSGLPDTLIAGWGMFVHSLAVQGANLYAGTAAEGDIGGAGVFLSTDSGTSWTAVNSGLPAKPCIRSLSVSGTQIFAATDTSGVFVSSDTGRSWAAVNSGLPDNTTIMSMLASGTDGHPGLSKSQAHSSAISGRQLFAGTYNRGVWRLPLSNAHIVDNPGKLKVDQQPKIRIASMRSRCRVSYTIASSCFVTLSLYSISGKLLSNMINKAQSPGNYTAAISHNVASGFYVLKFKAGNYEVTNKLLLQ